MGTYHDVTPVVEIFLIFLLLGRQYVFPIFLLLQKSRPYGEVVVVKVRSKLGFHASLKREPSTRFLH